MTTKSKKSLTTEQARKALQIVTTTVDALWEEDIAEWLETVMQNLPFEVSAVGASYIESMLRNAILQRAAQLESKRESKKLRVGSVLEVLTDDYDAIPGTTFRLAKDLGEEWLCTSRERSNRGPLCKPSLEDCIRKKQVRVLSY